MSLARALHCEEVEGGASLVPRPAGQFGGMGTRLGWAGLRYTPHLHHVTCVLCCMHQLKGVWLQKVLAWRGPLRGAQFSVSLLVPNRVYICGKSPPGA